MELSPWSRSVSDDLKRRSLFGIRIDVIGADTGDEFLERSKGLSSYPNAGQFSRFLYHLNLTYEVSRLALDPQYRRFRFPKIQFRPTISRLRNFDQMVLLRLSQNSPWQLSSAFLFDVARAGAGALGALWLFVQCLDKLSTIPLNRRKLRAEIEKIELESDRLKREQSMMVAAVPTVSPSKELESEVRTQGAPKKPPRATANTENLVLPPAQSSRLFNSLRRRGAKRFYDENTQAILNLGFKVEEINIFMDDGSQRKK